MYFLIVRRYAPFATFAGGFEGDSRTGGSIDPHLSARTMGLVAFTAENVVAREAGSSGSTFDAAGDRLRESIGRHFSHVTTEILNIETGTATVVFTLHTAGANPLVPVVAPNIVTYIDFKASFTSTSVVFDGRVYGDTFPNCEVFVLDTESKGVMLFDYRTLGGQITGALRLFGTGNSLLGTFSSIVPTAGGMFVASQPTCPPTMEN